MTIVVSAGVIAVLIGLHAGAASRAEAWFIAHRIASQTTLARAQEAWTAHALDLAKRDAMIRVLDLRRELEEAEAAWFAIDASRAQDHGVAPRMRVVPGGRG